MLECQSTYKSDPDHLLLHAHAVQAAFGELEFILREIQDCCVMELLVIKGKPRSASNLLIRLVGESLHLVIPSLRFALAVPVNAGGRWSQGDELYEKLPGSSALAVLEWQKGLDKPLHTDVDDQVLNISSLFQKTQSDVRKEYELWLPSAEQLEPYHAFISYRQEVLFDSKLARTMFKELRSEDVGSDGMGVFLDQECLAYGCDDSRQQVVKALSLSQVLIVIISWEGLELMQGLRAESEVDEVLLQWILALELLESGHLHRCLPIVIGQVGVVGAAGSHCVTSIIQDGLLEHIPNIVCSKVAAAAVEELQRLGISHINASRLQSRTVRGTVIEILRCRGEWVTVWNAGDNCHSAELWELKLFARCCKRAITYIDQTTSNEVGF